MPRRHSSSRRLNSHNVGLHLAVWVPALSAVVWLFATGSAPGVAAGVFALATLGSILVGRTYYRRALLLRELQGSIEALAGALGQPIQSVQSAQEGDPLVTATTELGRLRSVTNGRIGGLAKDLVNLTAVFDATVSPVIATDAAGAVVLCNRAAEEFFERSPGSLAGASLEDLFTQAEVLGQHAAALAGRVRQGQVRIQRPDGARVYQVITSPLPLLGRTGLGALEGGVVLTLRDVTELATAVQLKTDFVANASHELRTPLSSIRAAVETLADGAWDDPPMRARLAQMIAGNVTRLEEMVRDLLDLSRLESPEAPVQVEQVRLSEVTTALREVLGPAAAERSLALAFELDPAVERLRTDPRLLTLICKNLLDNATKFAYEGTTVRVTAEVKATDEGRPSREGRREPGLATLRIRVIDQGVGIPFGHQQRVFERFFQVDPARSGVAQRRGTGLGLAIVKHAVKALGGAISVESVWKQGTTMTVELPGCVESGIPSPTT